MKDTEYKPDTSYRQRADIAEGNFFKLLSTYANSRLIDLASAWRSQFPKSSLKIIFGNGCESVSVNGERVTFWGSGGEYRWDTTGIGDKMNLSIVADAIEDVWYICDGYARGCPDDLEVLPDDSELGGKNEDRTESRKTGKGIFNYGGLPGYDCPRTGSPVDPVHV